MENQDRRIFFFFSSENSPFVEMGNSRFVENGNWRILVLWKTRIGEIFFFLFIREFSFCGKRELADSRFVENKNRRIFFFFFHSRILVLLKRRIPVLWKTGTGKFSFCGKPESEIFFFFFIREFLFC